MGHNLKLFITENKEALLIGLVAGVVIGLLLF